MFTSNFKNILKLLKNSVEAVEITCIDDHNIVIEQEDEYHHELSYKFYIKSLNSLTPNITYQICLKQLFKLIKNSTKTETIHFTDTDTHLHIRLYDILTSSTINFPLLYKQKRITTDIPDMNNFLLINTKTLNNVLKSIVNSSDFYKIVIRDNRYNIENIDAVIQSNITIEGMNDTVLGYETNIISNTCLQRLSKITLRQNIYINSSKLYWITDDPIGEHGSINTIIAIL